MKNFQITFLFAAWSLIASFCLGQKTPEISTIAQTGSTPRSGALAPAIESGSGGAQQQLAREAIIAAFQGDKEALDRVAEQAAAKEKKPSLGGPSAELSSKAALLKAWLTDDPEEQKRILKEITRSNPDPQVLRQARHALQADPLAQIRRLRRENHYNEATGLANYVLHLASNILTLNTESIPRFLVDFFFIWEPFVAISPQDRNAIVIYDQYRPEIQAQNATGVDNTIQRLKGRLRDKYIREHFQAAKWYMKHERWHEAYSAYDQAEKMQPGNSKAREGKLAAGREISADYRQQARLTEMQPQPALTEAEAADQRQLAAAILAGNPDEMQRQARLFREKNLASTLADDAAYAELTADTLAGIGESRGGAETYLRSRDARTNAAPHLKALEDSPDANPKAALRKAESLKKTTTRTYLLTCRKEDPNYPAIYPGMREQMHHIVASFGLFLPFDWVRRSIQVAVSNPIDDSPWRAAAVRYLETADPESDEFRELTRELVESFERQGMLNQARQYHARAFGQDPAYARKLDEQAAQRMRETADAQPDPSQKKALLKITAERYPNTKAARKARKKLAKLDRKQPDVNQIQKKDLVSWPDLWLNRGLRLDPQWFDGTQDNGEIGDDGVHFLAPDGRAMEFTIHYSGNKEEKKQIRPDTATYREIEKRLNAWKQEAQARARAEAVLDRPTFLLDLQGSAGPGGLDIYPQLQPITFDEEKLPLYRSPLEVGK